MNRTLIDIDLNDYPDVFSPLLKDAKVYDSSCSPEAKVIYIEKDSGYYLKKSPLHTLEKEATMTRFFGEKGLSAKVLEYLSFDFDWLLTSKIDGEDCTHAQYIRDPKRLCDTIASLLRQLHDSNFINCPIKNRTKDYLEGAFNNYKNGLYDNSYFYNGVGFKTKDDAWKFIERSAHLLKSDVILHGDYCLPNIMLKDWKFSGFIDVGGGGIGDRHIDLFWGAWTLNFNLKTDVYRERFFDCYGKDKIDTDILKLVSVIEAFG